MASAGPSLLGFFHMYHAHGDSFAGLLAQIRPTWIFDLRPVPAFDLVRLDRRRAFRLFEQYGTAYCDSNVCFELWDRSDPRIASGELAEAFSRYATGPDRPGLKGPIIFLVDDSSVISTAIEAFPRVLRPVPRRGWQVHIFDHRALQHV
ncbi:hypothetical protein [Haliangium sp.]|uniref:hypothetical protein n=1 Tax=Haliangium sp. TaxID=2663208 RepID=UPI003D14ED73